MIMVDTKPIKNVTYPNYYCNKCSARFRYKGKAKYPHCPICNSTTSQFTYENGIHTNAYFEKYFCACKKCNPTHIWLMKKDKYNKKTQCPICHFHSLGKYFHWYFVHEIQNKNSLEDLKKIIKDRFPLKRDVGFIKYKSDGTKEINYMD